jgi:hypothetical protein
LEKLQIEAEERAREEERRKQIVNKLFFIKR